MTAKTKTKTATASATTVTTQEPTTTYRVKNCDNGTDFSRFVKFVKSDDNIAWQVRLPLRFMIAKKIVNDSLVTIKDSELKLAYKYDKVTGEVSETELEPITYGFMGTDKDGDEAWVELSYGQGTLDGECFMSGIVGKAVPAPKSTDTRQSIIINK